MYVDGDVHIENQGELVVEAGSTLRLSNGKTLVMNDGMYCANAKAIVALNDLPVPVIRFEEILPLSAGIRVFPNLTTGIFTLELANVEENSGANVEIYGMMGELVQQTTLFGERIYRFDLSNKPRGIYIVRVLHDDNIFIEKVVRQ